MYTWGHVHTLYYQNEMPPSLSFGSGIGTEIHALYAGGRVCTDVEGAMINSRIAGGIIFGGFVAIRSNSRYCPTAQDRGTPQDRSFSFVSKLRPRRDADSSKLIFTRLTSIN